MSEQAVTAIATIIAQLGMSGVFVYLYFSNDRGHTETIKRKDEDIKALGTKVIQIVESSIQTNESLKSSVENNTKATDKLVDSVDQLLRSR